MTCTSLVPYQCQKPGYVHVHMDDKFAQFHWYVQRTLHNSIAMLYVILQDISSVIETTWISNYGKVCAGMDWELFPTADDAKVHDS